MFVMVRHMETSLARFNRQAHSGGIIDFIEKEKKMNDLSAHNSGWQLLRSVTAVDNPALAAATMDGKPSYAAFITAEHIRGLEFILAATGDDNGIVGVKVWSGKKQGGPARCIAAITFTLGTMLCNKDPQTQEATEPGAICRHCGSHFILGDRDKKSQ